LSRLPPRNPSPLVEIQLVIKQSDRKVATFDENRYNTCMISCPDPEPSMLLYKMSCDTQLDAPNQAATTPLRFPNSSTQTFFNTHIPSLLSTITERRWILHFQSPKTTMAIATAVRSNSPSNYPQNRTTPATVAFVPK